MTNSMSEALKAAGLKPANTVRITNDDATKVLAKLLHAHAPGAITFVPRVSMSNKDITFDMVSPGGYMPFRIVFNDRGMWHLQMAIEL